MSGGIYRRRTYPITGYADDPDEVWREFQRIRSHFMSLDQNNVIADGITRDRLAKPNASSHEGLSDFLASSVSGSGSTDPMYDYDSSTTDSYTQAAHDAVWIVDPNVSIEGVSRSSGVWLVTASAQFNNTGTAADSANLDVAVLSSRNGISASSGAALLDLVQLHASPVCVAAFIVPAGEFKFQVALRMNWKSSMTDPISVTRRSIMAFGMYR